MCEIVRFCSSPTRFKLCELLVHLLKAYTGVNELKASLVRLQPVVCGGFVIVLLLAMQIGIMPVGISSAMVTGPDYMRIDQQSAFINLIDNGQMARLILKTEGSIPLQPDSFISSNLMTGFAWVDLDTSRAIAILISGKNNLLTSPAFYQTLGGWHTYALGLSPGQSFPHDFCVSAIQPIAPTAQIGIVGNQVVTQLQRSSLFIQPSAFDTAIGFSLQVDRHCRTSLGLQISA